MDEWDCGLNLPAWHMEHRAGIQCSTLQQLAMSSCSSTSRSHPRRRSSPIGTLQSATNGTERYYRAGWDVTTPAIGWRCTDFCGPTPMKGMACLDLGIKVSISAFPWIFCLRSSPRYPSFCRLRETSGKSQDYLKDYGYKYDDYLQRHLKSRFHCDFCDSGEGGVGWRGQTSFMIQCESSIIPRCKTYLMRY